MRRFGLLPLLCLVPLLGCPSSSSTEDGDKNDDTGDTSDDNGGGGDDTSDTTDSGTGGDTGGPSGAFDNVTVRLSSGVETVIIVDWQTSEAATDAWVEYGPTTSYGMTAPKRPSDPERALVLGHGPGTTVHLRVGAVVGGETIYSDDHTITTGDIPRNIPSHDIVDNRRGEDFGAYVMTSFFTAGPGEVGVMVMNMDGAVVWHSDIREGFMPAVRPSRDGQAINYLVYPSVTDAKDAEICRADLDGESVSCFDVEYCHHDFWEMADGRFACLQEVADRWNGYDLVGDAIVIVNPDSGATEEIWNAFDDITPVRTSEWDEHILTRGVDWTHANGLWYDEASRNFFVSFYYFESIHKISQATGETEWIFGGDDSDFRLRGESFGPQHAPQWDPATDTLYLFDNSTSSSGGSRLASYVLDESRLEAEGDISWRHYDERRALVMGDFHAMPNGYFASAWGDVGEIHVYSPDGDRLWEYQPAPATSCTQVYVYDDMYTMAPN